MCVLTVSVKFVRTFVSKAVWPVHSMSYGLFESVCGGISN